MSKLKPYQDHSRPDVPEGGLSGQEMTLAVLLEQALGIREEVAAGLRSTKGSLQVEARSHKLLETHILIITRIVKQLSLDMQALERQIAHCDRVASGTTVAVQSLDQKNMAGIGDLRGRVTRCDAAIAKLGTDVSSGEQQLIGLQQEVAERRSTVDVRLKELEAKLHHDQRRLEALLLEHSQIKTSAGSDLQTQVKILDTRMSHELKEAKEQIHSLRKWTKQELTSSAQRSTQQQDKTKEAASKLADRLHALEARVEQFEAKLDQADCSQADRLKRFETKLGRRMSLVESNLHQEVQLLKQECLKGFLSVHGAMESLKQIGDIKSNLEKKLQNDIRDTCSKAAEQ